jgi:glucokinase
MKYRFGIDIGGTKCAVLLGKDDNSTDGKVTLLKKVLYETKKTNSPDEMISLFIRSIDEIIQEFDIAKDEIAGIGISCGGPLSSRERVILAPPNLPGWVNVPIGKILEDRFDVPVILENDANACAMAEWKYGAGRGCKNVVFLTFGTGLGAGLILDGKLYRGTNDMAGEVGHIRLTECGPVGFGKMGSLEGYCSGGGIGQIASMKVLEQIGIGIFPDIYTSGEPLDAKHVAIAADAGDSLAKEIFAMSGKYLGKGLSIIVDILNPEVIIIGSIFERSHHLLWPYAKAELEKESLKVARDVCRVVPSQLGDNIGDYAVLALV